jgi:transcriptional regulator with XRE-family HTH domain
MPSEPSPMLRRRQAGIRLRQLREAAGKSLTEVAAYLECSAAKVSRVETGRLLARIPDVRNMLDLYGVSDADRAELLDLVRESREKGWWHGFTDMLDESYSQFLGLEHSAMQIWQYEEYLVPGLLQTRNYAYAITANRPDVPEDRAERIVQLRMARQQQLLQRPEAPNLHFVLDESVLHRVAALGSTTGREQLDHFGELAERPYITLQILPYSAGVACHISFTIFGFADPADPKVVHIDGLSETILDSRVKTIGEYTTNFDVARSIALDPGSSAAFIRRISSTIR